MEKNVGLPPVSVLQSGGELFNVAHLLQKLKYKELLTIVKDEELELKGKKSKLIRELGKILPPEKIWEHYRKFRGSRLDVQEHFLVPFHEIMKQKDVEALLKRYECTLNDLPKVKDTDMMVLKIGARAGDVLRITRKSQTAGEAKYYRLVVRNV